MAFNVSIVVGGNTYEGWIVDDLRPSVEGRPDMMSMASGQSSATLVMDYEGREQRISFSGHLVENRVLIRGGAAMNINQQAISIKDNIADPVAPVSMKFFSPLTDREVDGGTTTARLANKLVDAGQNFLATVKVGDLVYNTTTDTIAYVTNVDNNTTLSLDDDIMLEVNFPPGEDYFVYHWINVWLVGGWKPSWQGAVVNEVRFILDLIEGVA